MRPFEIGWDACASAIESLGCAARGVVVEVNADWLAFNTRID